ncbi:MAG: hypothetical protein LKJ13_09310 [Clostridia bacterium]|jgi:hypothetical protein|nr:hypothetical protein [Clostridia bacterium]
MLTKSNVFDSYKGISAMNSEKSWPPFPPYPPCPPPCQRGPAGPPGPQGLRGLPGSLNNTAISFAYAQLANLIKQLIEYYPTNTLNVYIIGFTPSLVSGLPYDLYSSTEGTFGSLFILDDGGNHQAVPLSAICAMQFDTTSGSVAYNPAITYIPKPDFPPGYDTNEITAIHDYVGDMTTDVQFYMASHVASNGSVYLNPYGLIVQANTDGTNPLFIPVMHIIAFEPYTTTTTGGKSDSTQVKITT